MGAVSERYERSGDGVESYVHIDKQVGTEELIPGSRGWLAACRAPGTSPEYSTGVCAGLVGWRIGVCSQWIDGDGNQVPGVVGYEGGLGRGLKT